MAGEFILIIPILLLSLSVHEYAHGKAADLLGDPTARLMGRLTINPLAHLDPIGALVLLITRRFGWAKPVPINPANLRNPQKDVMLVSLAGPLANIILSFLFSLLYRVFFFAVTNGLLAYKHGNAAYFINQMIGAGVYMNLGLAFFNLIPIPPLDGSKILLGLAPRNWYGHIRALEGPVGTILLLVLVYTGLLARLISPLINLFAQLFLIGL